MAFKHEVWSNYMCNLRFLNEKNEILYSKNLFCTNLSDDLNEIYYFIKSKKFNCILLHEFRRPNISQLSLLNFTDSTVTVLKNLNDNFFNSAIKDFEEGDFKIFNEKGVKSKFNNEKIKLPIFKIWSKSKKIF